MQDRLGDLRELVNQVNPTAAGQLKVGPSVVLDTALLSGEGGGFDITEQMGLKKTDEEQFMDDFFTRLDVLKKSIADVKIIIDKIKVLKHEAIRATAPEEEKSISNKLHDLVNQANREVLTLKKKLEILKEENASFAAKNVNSAEARIRENLHAAVTRKFKEILKEYQSVQTDYKKEVREKVTRQVKIVFPEANEDEVADMVAEGNVGQAIKIRMTGQAHESLQNAVADMADKYRDIRRLEESVAEMHQMFVDLSTLIGAQGELLDQIEFNVRSAKDYTEKGEKELVGARKHQKAMKKRMCYITICIGVLAVIIAIPVITVVAK